MLPIKQQAANLVKPRQKSAFLTSVLQTKWARCKSPIFYMMEFLMCKDLRQNKIDISDQDPSTRQFWLKARCIILATGNNLKITPPYL
jgi:hypothetical protein